VKNFSLRLPAWSGVWLVIAVLVAGAVFLSIGLALAIAFLVIAGVALLPTWLRSLWSRKRAPQGPATLEGVYTKIEQ